jgi:hypothetical protein
MRKAWLLVVLMGVSLVSAKADEPEALISAKIDGDSLTVEVAGRSCTQAGNFRVDVSKTKLGPDLLIVRVTPDGCNGPVTAMAITFSLSALGVAADKGVGIRNAFTSTR